MRCIINQFFLEITQANILNFSKNKHLIFLIYFVVTKKIINFYNFTMIHKNRFSKKCNSKSLYSLSKPPSKFGKNFGHLGKGLRQRVIRYIIKI